MNCPYCTKPLESYSLSDRWPWCKLHKNITVYCNIGSNAMQWLIEDPSGMTWLCWDADGGFRITTGEVKDGIGSLILRLDHHPQITPEEAQVFLDRILKMKAFT